MEIYLIRHTQVAVPLGTCYGNSDVQLAHTFEEEANRICEFLPKEELIQCYSSPLSRCVRLAERLYPGKIILDERLKEMHFGSWEMQLWNAIDATHMQQWKSDFVSQRAPEGESYQILYNRVVEFWDEMVQPVSPFCMAVVTHGGVIRALLSHLLDIPLKHSFKVEISYGSITKISVTPAKVLVEYINRSLT